jgi:hypothetical protein
MNKILVAFVKASIVVLVLFIIVYTLSYNKWKKNSNFDDVDITYRETGDNGEQIDITQKETSHEELYNSLNFEFVENNYGEEFFPIYYGSQEMDFKYYIYMAITNIIKNDTKTNCNLTKTIKKSDVDKMINSLFGPVPYVDLSFSTNNNYMVVDYDLDNYLYTVTINNKCSEYDFSQGGIKTQYLKEEYKNNALYIYEKAYYVEYGVDGNGLLSFNYHSGVDKNSPIISKSVETLDLNKVDTYVYKFVKEKTGFGLVSIDKISA